ncbi:hypothetical protein J3U75_09105 [Snodgrassella sp. B3088]|uniref:hypothetical protein n=1 Tax=unclassified Snodgrassella TaxID=2625236 RepID=UPI00226A6EAF|nr:MULTISPECIES: hypothetical protein [unclassified Snodgrassella]MCX8749529.1 hypothetical protein [Snodgrassella sp. B3088]MCX8753108.1 hypothetical protein [Snodgrassella sp. B3837]
MLIDTLQEFNDLYNKLWQQITDENEVKNFINHADVTKATYLLKELVKINILRLASFKLFLQINKNEALLFLKDWYLSRDLSNYGESQILDIGLMLSDIKDILGEKELNNILNCKEFLSKNKKNKWVKEAIMFAKQDD